MTEHDIIDRFNELLCKSFEQQKQLYSIIEDRQSIIGKQYALLADLRDQLTKAEMALKFPKSNISRPESTPSAGVKT